MKNFFRENLYLKLTIIGIIVIVLSVYLFILTFSPKGKTVKQTATVLQVASVSAPKESQTTGPSLTGGVLCSVSIEQPKCYEGNFPTPTFKWEYCDSNSIKNQKIFRVQVDDQAYQNGVFPSPEIDSGEVKSADTKYSLSSAGLEFNSTYYWGVTITDKSDVKTGWWGWGDKNFTTAPSCK